ncbi:HNH nuclease [uncultured Caudovirales phage]|uniref:HNH nuclease n=1 Tax=uncultured Caudovirales phage TaxID=2100421 RepID=A0A6J5T541_9CAUD|nr:HNH nuclease [uncultured Caudovirales phage]CAB4196264.1 HNH nuclease [uncultured Caudovirales phage]CAB4222326.1 HNH nuclease [uncultured Caudovirales phage]
MTPERLREVLSYNPWTGEFRWRVQLSPRGCVGNVAGRLTDQSFIKITIDGRGYLAHRLAWLYMKRQWPARLINHKNRNRSDNRWPNLREATSSQIQAHAKPRRRMSRGVDWVRKDRLFRSRIKVAGRAICLGYFRTEEQASRAYRAAARGAFGEFAAST